MRPVYVTFFALLFSCLCFGCYSNNQPKNIEQSDVTTTKNEQTKKYIYGWLDCNIVSEEDSVSTNDALSKDLLDALSSYANVFSVSKSYEELIFSFKKWKFSYSGKNYQLTGSFVATRDSIKNCKIPDVFTKSSYPMKGKWQIRLGDDSSIFMADVYLKDKSGKWYFMQNSQ